MAGNEQGRRRKTRKKRELKWLAYYCKVSAFEAYGNEHGSKLELDLELLEPVPKVSSLTLAMIGETPELKIEERRIPDHGTERRLVAVPRDLRSHAMRRPDGSVSVTTWWDREGVMAMTHMLLGGVQLYVSFNAKEFYRNWAEATGIEWFTPGKWRSDVVGEDSDLF